MLHAVGNRNVEADPVDSAASEAVREAILSGNDGRAEALLDPLLKVRPDDAELHFLIAVVKRRNGEVFEAALACERALLLGPPQATWLESMKNLTTDIGGSGELATWEACAAKHWIAALAYGNALRRLGRLAEAELAYRSAAPPEVVEPYLARRLACLYAVTGRLDEADAIFRRTGALALSPDGNLRLSSQFLSEIDASGESSVRQLPQLQGEVPDSVAAPIAFLLSCDPVYFRRFARAVVNSIRANCRCRWAVHFHIVDPDDSVLAEVTELALQTEIAEHSLTWEFVPAGTTVQRSTWYACTRFARLPGMLRRLGCPIWVLDLDQLVVNDPQNLVVPDDHGAPDVAMICWHPTAHEPWETFSATAVYVAPTPGGLSFADRTAAYTAAFLNTDRAVWFLDQIALFTASTIHGTHCKLRALPAETASLASPAQPAEPPPSAVFWTIVGSVQGSEVSMEHPVFRRYAEWRRASPAESAQGVPEV